MWRFLVRDTAAFIRGVVRMMCQKCLWHDAAPGSDLCNKCELEKQTCWMNYWPYFGGACLLLFWFYVFAPIITHFFDV